MRDELTEYNLNKTLSLYVVILPNESLSSVQTPDFCWCFSLIFLCHGAIHNLHQNWSPHCLEKVVMINCLLLTLFDLCFLPYFFLCYDKCPTLLKRLKSYASSKLLLFCNSFFHSCIIAFLHSSFLHFSLLDFLTCFFDCSSLYVCNLCSYLYDLKMVLN